MSDTDDFDDSLDEEDIEIAKPTPMMKVWIRDAEEFGIPFEVQKGLIFLIAFGLRSIFQPPSLEDWISHTKKLSSKIRLKSPHIPKGQGGNFCDDDFSPLLTEFAERFMGNRGQCAFSFIFLKTNSWQVDCGWDLREKGQSHILTYFKLRDPSSDGTSVVRHLKTLPSDSTNCRLAKSH